MTRKIRTGNLQKNSSFSDEREDKNEFKYKTENLGINQGYKKTEFVCFNCGSKITVENENLKNIVGTIKCPICSLESDISEESEDVEEISVDELAEQVKKLTELSQQQIEIQKNILAKLGL